MDEITMAAFVLGLVPGLVAVYMCLALAFIALAKYAKTLFESADQTALADAVGAMATAIKSGTVPAPVVTSGQAGALTAAATKSLLP